MTHLEKIKEAVKDLPGGWIDTNIVSSRTGLTRDQILRVLKRYSGITRRGSNPDLLWRKGRNRRLTDL